MASQYYGRNRGQNEFDITQGTATQSTDVEVRFDLTKNLDKHEVLIALDDIKHQILKDNFPNN